MTNTRRIILIAATALGAVAWYLFRPELLFIDERVNDAAPTVASVTPAPAPVLATGTFVSDAHETVGRVTLQRTESGTVLRLEGFSTSNGPDVRVYLVAVDSIAGSATVKRAETIDLGALKGNVGDQNYVVPAGVDLAKYKAVSIWCRRFAVNFGAAVLGHAGA
jgi:hypothetical protein